MNKVTFKSWCHPLLAVSALCLLSGAPDPPRGGGDPEEVLVPSALKVTVSPDMELLLFQNVSQLCQQIDDLLCCP